MIMIMIMIMIILLLLLLLLLLIIIMIIMIILLIIILIMIIIIVIIQKANPIPQGEQLRSTFRGIALGVLLPGQSADQEGAYSRRMPRARSL